MNGHFKAAGDDLYVYISCLFSGLLTHGVVPDDVANTIASVLVGSRLDYADAVLVGVSDKDITKLQRTQTP